MGLSAAPAEHAELHSRADHSCIITLFSDGGIDTNEIQTHAVAPCLLPGAKASSFRLNRAVPALFLSAAVFEHAPPVEL
jgi:hypothetical protein